MSIIFITIHQLAESNVIIDFSISVYLVIE